jgi:hypothetical protein
VCSYATRALRERRALYAARCTTGACIVACHGTGTPAAVCRSGAPSERGWRAAVGRRQPRWLCRSDMQKEYSRHREYLEKSVEGLKRKIAKDMELHRTDNSASRRPAPPPALGHCATARPRRRSTRRPRRCACGADGQVSVGGRCGRFVWDAVRIMHENVSLLSEINELRRELKAMKDMQARTFPSRPFRTERAPNVLHAPLCTHP